MKWNEHYRLEEAHAFLSPSNYHWINYTPEKLTQVYINHLKKEEGTLLHSFASIAIVKKLKMANHKKALNQFVNDAIGFGMESEMILYYSDNCFGTADAIMYEDGVLRVHDLKTGNTKPSFNQLKVYCALFCLEYDHQPEEMTFITRLYQFTGFDELVVDPNEVRDIMNHIIHLDAVIDGLKNSM